MRRTEAFCEDVVGHFLARHRIVPVLNDRASLTETLRADFRNRIKFSSTRGRRKYENHGSRKFRKTLNMMRYLVAKYNGEFL